MVIIGNFTFYISHVSGSDFKSVVVLTSFYKSRKEVLRQRIFLCSASAGCMTFNKTVDKMKGWKGGTIWIKRNRYLVPLDLGHGLSGKLGILADSAGFNPNFYDSIGYEKFHKEFDYNHTVDKTGNITLTMKTKNHPFSYEWLTYFGGSTKTGQEGYVGNYGEGFKLCALCLVRMGCDFIMESQNWKLRPQVYTKKIDGQNTRMLGYQVEEREDDGETCLVVTGIDKSRERIIQEGLLEFFYQGNPLLAAAWRIRKIMQCTSGLR